MPTEPGDSWFSPKCIEVQPQRFSRGGKALNGLGGEKPTKPNQTANATVPYSESEAVGDNLHCQEGKNPDHQLRSLSIG